MSSLIPFSFESYSVRAFNIDGTPWFVAKDVASALGYKNPADAVTLHCKGVAKRYPLSTAGGIQDVRVINEPDTFRLIVGSNLPEAERFERWLFEEVLPTIRQTGAYALPGASSAVVASIADLRSQLEMIAKLVKWAEPMLADLEAQVGGASRPAVPIQPRHQKPTRRRSIAPADIWESDVRAFMADRQEVTTTLVLDYLAVPPADQTQVSKNWIARILKNMGFVSCVVKRGGRTHRVWQRNH